jgi:hypothetical protein
MVINRLINISLNPDNHVKTRNLVPVILFIGILLFLICCTHKEGHGDYASRDENKSAALLIGFARENITPPAGMRLCGTFEERLAEGVHDSLYVRAFVFSQGKTKFAIAGCDLAMVFPEICDSVRARVKYLGLSTDHVLIHGSETHNGPDYFGEFRDVFHQRAIDNNGYDPAEPVDYSQILVEKVSNAIISADKDALPSRLDFSSGICEGIAFYRRYRMKDGSVGWNPGKLNPQIVEPLGPVDEYVPVLSIFQENTKEPKAIITGFAMHLAILDDANYGADYPYYLEQKLIGEISPALFTHFLQAPCCEVNHIDVSTPKPQSGHTWAKVVGEELATAILEVLRGPMSFLQPDLKTRSLIVPLVLQEFLPEETEVQRRIWHSPERVNMHFLDVVYAGKVASIIDRHHGGPVRSLLQAFQIDQETAIVGLPSEISVELGMHIRKYSPYRNTVIVQLSNDWFGYIPPKRIFEEGHYEAVVTKIQPGEGEKLAEMALTLLMDLKNQ